MTEKKYEFTPSAKFNEAFARYLANENDREAGEFVDNAVKERMERSGETYSKALHSLSYESNQGDARPYENIPRPRPQLFAEASREIEKWTVKLMADLQIDRRTAIRLACGLCPDHYGPTYTGCAVKRLSVDEVYKAYGKSPPRPR
jgi:hypothetical protein